MSVPVQLDNREQLIKSASTSLNSKVVFQQSSLLAPLSVDAVLKIVDPSKHFEFPHMHCYIFLIFRP